LGEHAYLPVGRRGPPLQTYGSALNNMETFTELTIFLVAIILLTRLGSFISRRFNIPFVTIQLLIGILLGPSVLNLLGAPMVLGTWGSPSPHPLHSILKILAEIGLIQLMFLAGLEVDWHELKKLFKSSFSVGAWGFLLSVGSVIILTRLFVDRWAEALAMSAIVSASSFGISIYCLSEMKVLGSRVGVTVSGAAVLSGLLTILLMIASQATNYGMAYGVLRMVVAVSWFFGKLIMFFAIAYFLTSRFLKLSSKSGFQKRPRQILIGYLLLVASLYAWAAMHFGSFAAVGVASLGGALLGLSNLEVKGKIAKGYESILASIPVGILFMVIGMEVNLKAAESSIFFLAVLLVAVVGAKLIGCWIATNKGYESSRERVLIMFGVLAQGEMGIVAAAYLFSRGLLNPPSFNVAIIAVAFLTMLTPVLTKITYTEFNVQRASIPASNPPKSPFSKGEFKGDYL
jgi:Kef-type K+ transport system membrane component KefB